MAIEGFDHWTYHYTLKEIDEIKVQRDSPVIESLISSQATQGDIYALSLLLAAFLIVLLFGLDSLKRSQE